MVNYGEIGRKWKILSWKGDSGKAWNGKVDQAGF
jgi:hypothetical protein